MRPKQWEIINMGWGRETIFNYRRENDHFTFGFELGIFDTVSLLAVTACSRRGCHFSESFPQ